MTFTATARRWFTRARGSAIDPEVTPAGGPESGGADDRSASPVAGEGSDPPSTSTGVREWVEPLLSVDDALGPTARAVMRDSDSERLLATRGYVVVDLLDADEVRELHDFYVTRAEAGDLNPPGAYDDTFAEFTIVNSRADFRREAFDRICSVLMPRVEAQIVGCRPVIANFVNKPAGSGLVPIHQNITVVDESRHRSVSVWVALVDCAADNGTLQFVDHSHLSFRGRRGQWAYSDYVPISDTVAGHLTPVDVRAGQAVVLDDAVIHYSAANHSQLPRLAIQLVVAPIEAETVYWEKIAEHGDLLELDELAVGPDYFFDFWLGAGDPRNGRLCRQVKQRSARLDQADFEETLAKGRKRAEAYRS